MFIKKVAQLPEVFDLFSRCWQNIIGHYNGFSIIILHLRSTEAKALENPTNGALYLVISPLLVHVVNALVTDCQL